MSQELNLVGHTSEVLAFLDTCKKTTKRHDMLDLDCEKVIYTMYNWESSDGSLWEEFAAYSPLGSKGPMIFLGLFNRDTNEIKSWTKDASLKDSNQFYDRKKGIFWVS